MQDPDQLLWLALTARNSGSRPSALVGIDEELTALELDLACTLRLVQYDNKAEEERFRMLAALLGAEVSDPVQLEENVTVV